MWTEREKAIHSVLMEHVGGTYGNTSGDAVDPADPATLARIERSMAINKRRMIIFTLLFSFVLISAVSVMVFTFGDYNVLLWVGVGAFNAANAAFHYAAYQKKKLAYALFDVLGQDEA